MVEKIPLKSGKAAVAKLGEFFETQVVAKVGFHNLGQRRFTTFSNVLKIGGQHCIVIAANDMTNVKLLGQRSTANTMQLIS